jgi:hypothetical protein
MAVSETAETYISVGIETAYGMESRGIGWDSPQGQEIFQWLRTHPASYPMGTAILSLLEKWSRRETDNSPPSTVEVTNVWSYVWTSPYTVMAWCVIN